MRKQQSALVYILKGLMPYTRQNLALSFSPNRFFNELEKQTGYSNATLRHSYERARREKLIHKHSPKLTKEGLRIVQPFVAHRLKGPASLMVIFDIPEYNAPIRRQFRGVLKGWGFQQVQKSVWVSDKDYRSELIDIIAEMGLGKDVEIFESSRLYP